MRKLNPCSSDSNNLIRSHFLNMFEKNVFFVEMFWLVPTQFMNSQVQRRGYNFPIRNNS
jgi:hypothetical protein